MNRRRRRELPEALRPCGVRSSVCAESLGGGRSRFGARAVSRRSAVQLQAALARLVTRQAAGHQGPVAVDLGQIAVRQGDEFRNLPEALGRLLQGHEAEPDTIRESAPPDAIAFRPPAHGSAARVKPTGRRAGPRPMKPAGIPVVFRLFGARAGVFSLQSPARRLRADDSNRIERQVTCELNEAHLSVDKVHECLVVPRGGPSLPFAPLTDCSLLGVRSRFLRGAF